MPAEILPAQTADRLAGFLANSGNRGRQIHFAQIGFDGFAIDGLAADAAGLAHPRGRSDGVSGRQRLIRKPRVGDEAARSRGAHHVSAPKRVDP